MVRANCDITGTQIKRFNDFIRGELKRRNLKMDALADYLGMTRSNLSYLLNGKVQWLFKNVLNVCQFFDKPIEEIIGRG